MLSRTTAQYFSLRCARARRDKFCIANLSWKNCDETTTKPVLINNRCRSSHRRKLILPKIVPLPTGRRVQVRLPKQPHPQFAQKRVNLGSHSTSLPRQFRSPIPLGAVLLIFLCLKCLHSAFVTRYSGGKTKRCFRFGRVWNRSRSSAQFISNADLSWFAAFAVCGDGCYCKAMRLMRMPAGWRNLKALSIKGSNGVVRGNRFTDPERMVSLHALEAGLRIVVVEQIGFSASAHAGVGEPFRATCVPNRGFNLFVFNATSHQ